MRFGVLALVLVLAACESDETILAAALEKEFTKCTERFVAGELQSHEARATCDHWSAIGTIQEWALSNKYGDLVALLTAKRKELAHLLDAEALTRKAADARYDAFYAQFLREIAEREKRYNANFPSEYLNYCEFAGDGMLCTRPPRPEAADRERERIREDCDLLANTGEISSAEEETRCVMGRMVHWVTDHQIINSDLGQLLLDHALSLSRQLDAGKIAPGQARELLKDISRQIKKEKRERHRLRTSGDLNWRIRECRIEDNGLHCK